MNLRTILLIVLTTVAPLTPLSFSLAQSDSYKIYQPRKEQESEKEEAKEENVPVPTISGVGLMLAINEDTKAIFVKDIFLGTPASYSEIMPGDELLEVDGSSVANSSLRDCANKVRGKTGSNVTLTVLRGTKKLKVILVREEYTPQ